MSTEQPKHAKYSASQASQWLNCHGVQGMKTLVPKQVSGDAANEGTAAHELLERCLSLKVDAYEQIDELIFVETDEGETLEYIVDDEMADAVQVCIDVVNGYLKEYPEADIKLEQKVDISELCGKDMYGTVDVRIAVPFHKLIIIDYKHGRGVPVNVVENKQLIYYSLGAAFEEDFEFEEVEMVIVQPRCPKVADVQEHVMTMEEVREWATAFRLGRTRAEKAEKEIIKAGKPIASCLKAGDWCTFCPAKAICPAKHKQMIDLAQVDFDDEEKIMLPDPKNIPMEQWLRVLEHGDSIKKYIDAVHSEAQSYLDCGNKIPGYKLVKKKSNAKFKEEESLVVKILVKAGFEKDDITRTKIETLGKLRKLCGKDFIETLTYKPDTGNTMAAEADKRPGVEASAVSDFDD